MEPPLTPSPADPDLAETAIPASSDPDGQHLQEGGRIERDQAPGALERTDAAPDVEALQALVLARLDDDQAQDVVIIDLKGKSSLADTIVIASGRSQRHVSAMADHLLRAVKTSGWGRAQVEGLPSADWVLIDASDVIVHIFRPEVRAFYNIEKIWSVEPPASAERTRHGFVDPDLTDGGPLEQESLAAS